MGQAHKELCAVINDEATAILHTASWWHGSALDQLLFDACMSPGGTHTRTHTKTACLGIPV